MAGRPRHEALRGHVIELLRSGFGASYEDIAHEVYLLDNTGRIDTLWGATVIELKTDLRREIGDVLQRMPVYLADAAARVQGPRSVTGLATDGATFIAYTLSEGALKELARYETNPDKPDELMGWLEPLLSDQPDLLPEPRAVAQAFGRGSLAFATARISLETLWKQLGADPEVRLKRELWDGLLREAYGQEVGGDALFLQHTYLTFVVKSIAARVLDLDVDNPASLLSGQALVDEGIVGAVEADFFDWPLKLGGGIDLLRQVAIQVARFRLRDVQTDVLKVLYESLVDPDERHDLGEYYTPDWLAERTVAATLDNPLHQRALDPACGSGTFLFHAIRRLAAAGKAAGWTGEQILNACADQVRGLDVHPVAITLARVTWLLALGDLILDRPARLTVPVFLGDAMQWNLRRYLDRADVLVEVPDEQSLQIPTGLAEDQAIFEQALDVLSHGLRDNASPKVVGFRLRQIAGANTADADALAITFGRLQELYRNGRNGIWLFVFRNLVRPVWLSRDEQRADVLIGNPPWIVYRHLSPKMKNRLREGLEQYGLWMGGTLATQQDMFALFWARGAERYLKTGGRIGFVLPYAVLNAPVFTSLRLGQMHQVQVRVIDGWALERVWPIFGAQSGSSTTSTCVLFGVRDEAGDPPPMMDRWHGRLARRDASEEEAARALTKTRVAWPRARTLIGASLYRPRFRQGATIVPRRFFIVDPEPTSRLGGRRDAPKMRGRAGSLDKKPWTTVEPPRGPVEIQFLRRLILGETVAPFRLFKAPTAVIPLEGNMVLDAAAARNAQHRHLAAWLDDAEAKWAEHSNKNIDGLPRMTLTQRIDHMRNLSLQGGPLAYRVIYAASGTKISAARVLAGDALIEHGAYWANTRSEAEASYLLAILNSDATLAKVSDLQPRGEVNPRHFDNLVWTLPIPEYDPEEELHRDLASAAAKAEAVAAAIPFTDEQHFVGKRKLIRAALAEDGVAAEIEVLVDALLPP